MPRGVGASLREPWWLGGKGGARGFTTTAASSFFVAGRDSWPVENERRRRGVEGASAAVAFGCVASGAGEGPTENFGDDATVWKLFPPKHDAPQRVGLLPMLLRRFLGVPLATSVLPPSPPLTSTAINCPLGDTAQSCKTLVLALGDEVTQRGDAPRVSVLLCGASELLSQAAVELDDPSPPPNFCVVAVVVVASTGFTVVVAVVSLFRLKTIVLTVAVVVARERCSGGHDEDSKPSSEETHTPIGS